MKLKRIHSADTGLLQNFLKQAGTSLERFRYFASRGFEVLNNHAVTYLLTEKETGIAYGHLDKEGDTVWLGTCVAEKHTGKGLGKKMMQALMNFAREHKIEKVKLSVDKVNEAARKLYLQFGFEEVEVRESFSFFEWELHKNPEILISSLAFMGQPAEKIIEQAQQHKWALEFSSGMPYRPDMEEIFLKAPIKKYAHNYFPAPQKPFVLNLASKDEATRRTSIEHCLNGMRLSEAAGARFFSAHAGFCIDPKPEELGERLSRDENIDRAFHWKLFIESVNEILAKTADSELRFLIENNVLAQMNVYENGLNPLFCADAAEMIRLINEVNNPRLGLLLDTAHLKVSSNTLGFDKHKATEQVTPYIGCIHHSDNAGEFDNNLPFEEDDYWFLKHMPAFKHVPHVIEVKKIDKLVIEYEVEMLKEWMMNEHSLL